MSQYLTKDFSLRYLAVKTSTLLAIVVALSACGGGSGGNNDDTDQGPVGEDLTNTVAFESDGPYANVLSRCIQATTPNSAPCTLNTLPPLGLDNENLSIPMIMDRLVVSHQWMGTRFEYILLNLPSEMLNLFKGVTAIVIDDDIRPANYKRATAAIYLDPAFIWLSNLEKRTINQKEDFRAGFADPLAFRSLWRYVEDGRWVSSVGSLTDNQERTLEDIIPNIARLLLHELAHANDIIPPSSYNQLNRSLTPVGAINEIVPLQPSYILSTRTPLESDLMYELGDVMFKGYTPSPEMTAITATQVGDEFEVDGAADDYAYSSRYEDTAMLFEETMMHYLFGMDRDIVFSSAPDDKTDCGDYIIKWGVRNRIGDTDVKARAQYVTSQLLPDLDLTMYFQDLAPPTELVTEVDWCDRVNLDGMQSALQKLSSPNGPILVNPELIPYL